MMGTKTVAARLVAGLALLISAVVLAASVFAAPAKTSGIVDADDDSYQGEVVRSKLPVILFFYAKWCGACRKAAPTVENIASELDGRVKVVRMNVDESRTTATRFKVRSIPAFFYLEDGNVRGEAIGALSKEKLLKKLGVPEKEVPKN